MARQTTFRLRFLENAKAEGIRILTIVDLSTKFVNKLFQWFSVFIEVIIVLIVLIISIFIITPSLIFWAFIKSIKKSKKAE